MSNPYEIDYDAVVKLIKTLMRHAHGVSNTGKPWADNTYGRAATALKYILPTDHPLNPHSSENSIDNI